ncbi:MULTISPECIES: vanadium-dependent haloperoxidase [unclassified Massilia]|uniref:vanadium-dependent haloperoxidase n=1 Tax=unclassified Massilia TaxID=2609279 RepID=UPI00177DFABA|nr:MULTISPECIES: vanadium-dependent haloperoxidase [unclassified Massilia]MBD8529732.1 phosphatase PAP2 family protein [Massilia sp. CFBP 13647]MBD8673181.1 phosphatase PAP2 family protein [Massilia sp. CFBP 13721]
MKPRIALLFCSLFVPLFMSIAAAQPYRPGPRPPAGMAEYLTQPGTRELPPRYQPPAGPNAKARLAYWNEVALRAIAVDHTPPYAGAGPALMPEQLGPTRTSRVLAIVQLAVYDALNAIVKRYPGYSGALPAFGSSSQDAAIAQAAHDTLVALYPRQAARFSAWLQADLARLPDDRARRDGIDIGRRAAAAILALRAADGVYYGEPVVGVDYQVSNAPGAWRPDPVSRVPIALGAYWGDARPFVLPSPIRYQAPPPPALASEAYARAFAEVKALGGDGVRTPTRRTREQTVAGIYWGYDGTAWVGTRPRLYNQIAMQLALARCADPLELARVLALVNVAIADTTIAVWQSKYTYDFWRPVTAIREADPGTGPTGLGDGNPATLGDPHWTPLGSPASNLTGPDFTPPFPAYVSGHAALGSATFHMLRRLYGDAVPFTFVSDEFSGITRDSSGHVRPRLPRSFASLSQAEEENGQSRIYLGVHWRFDKEEGTALARRIADDVFARGLVRPGAR